jgi:GT2 family glycosyltransferase
MSEHVSKAARPTVSVIVLNYNGLDFLPRCLETLQKTTYSPLELVVADNNSTDGSLKYLRSNYPKVRIIEFSENLGYAGAYNAAIQAVDSDVVVLLNFDVEVEPDWLDQPMELLMAEPRLAAVQPKLRALQSRQRFEYAGGSGGFLDRYGYPFLRGRVFDTLEEDHGQYDDVVSIFWATGAALVTRRQSYLDAGGLDADFFLHMEEIDLCWRYHLLGWDIKVAPRGVVYHYSGAALSAERFHKMYFNHRNSLAMLFKNYGTARLFLCLPVRWLLDGFTVVTSVFRKEPKRSAAVLAAYWYLIVHLPSLMAKRRRVQRMRAIPDRALDAVIFPGSLVRHYFIKKNRTFSQLMAEW